MGKTMVYCPFCHCYFRAKKSIRWDCSGSRREAGFPHDDSDKKNKT
jgi:hypothetical protein